VWLNGDVEELCKYLFTVIKKTLKFIAIILSGFSTKLIIIQLYMKLSQLILSDCGIAIQNMIPLFNY
jgi:hypothetical protein